MLISKNVFNIFILILFAVFGFGLYKLTFFILSKNFMSSEFAEVHVKIRGVKNNKIFFIIENVFHILFEKSKQYTNILVWMINCHQLQWMWFVIVFVYGYWYWHWHLCFFMLNQSSFHHLFHLNLFQLIIYNLVSIFRLSYQRFLEVMSNHVHLI